MYENENNFDIYITVANMGSAVSSWLDSTHCSLILKMCHSIECVDWSSVEVHIIKTNNCAGDEKKA